MIKASAAAGLFASTRPVFAAAQARVMINPGLLDRAMASLEQHRDRIDHADVIGIADYSRPSREHRFYLLQLASGTYEMRVCAGGPAVSGEVILHADALYVQVSIGGFGRGEILLRRCRGRADYVGERNHWARMAELVDPATLAARIARELGLAMPVELQPRLVA